MRRYSFIHIAGIVLITIIICFWVKRSVRVLRKGFITSGYQSREDCSRRCPLLHNLAFVTSLQQARSSGQTPRATSTVPPVSLGRRWRESCTVYLQTLLLVVGDALILGKNPRLPHRSLRIETRFFLQSPCSSHIRSELSLRDIVPYHMPYQLHGVLK
jgi:hypothetical protein